MWTNSDVRCAGPGRCPQPANPVPPPRTGSRKPGTGPCSRCMAQPRKPRRISDDEIPGVVPFLRALLVVRLTGGYAGPYGVRGGVHLAHLPHSAPNPTH